MLEFLEHGVADLKVLGNGLMDAQIIFAELEEGAVLYQSLLGRRQLGLRRTSRPE